MSTKTITGIYESPLIAENAITLLKTKGYRDAELSILTSKSSIETNIKIEENSKAPEGISIGASIGGTLGAALAGLTAVGAITLTGGTALLASGPIVAALAGAGAGAAAGGLTGGLIGMGIPETEAKIIDERLSTGNVLVGVTINEDQKNQTKDLLESTGAKEVKVH